MEIEKEQDLLAQMQVSESMPDVLHCESSARTRTWNLCVMCDLSLLVY